MSLRCDHCLLEFPEREAVREKDAGAERVFCCTGCQGIHRLIREEGLGAFYEGRRWEETGLAARPEDPQEVEAFRAAVREGKDGLSEVDLYVEGIRCASCVWLNERLLGKLPGVTFARVNYATHRARVRFDPGVTGLASVLGRIRSAGYLPKPYGETEGQAAQRRETRDLLVRLGTAGFLSSQLMVITIALYAGYFQGIDPGTRRLLEWVGLGLTLPVYFYAGAPFLRNTVTSLRHGRFNMDALIALGAGAALAYSAWQMFAGGEVYLDTAAMIVTLVLVGRYVESAAKGRASEAVARLAALQPREARRIETRADGSAEVRRVPVAELRPGDRVEVVPGERVPADGVVAEGRSEVDESLVTGESRPVGKEPGSPAIGGTVNLHGSFVLAVTRTGAATVLSGIIRAVEEAQASRPRIQAVADRLVGVFVPAILVLAVAATAGHLLRGTPVPQALMIGVSVLVIACPCALGLATPLAVLLATGVATGRGLLVKGGDVFERAAGADEALLDKTGTVTRGRPEVREVLPIGEADADEALRLAASVERRSEHSLGRAVVEAARALPGDAAPEATDFRSVPGRGVEARVQGERGPGGEPHLRDRGCGRDPGGGRAGGVPARGAGRDGGLPVAGRSAPGPARHRRRGAPGGERGRGGARLPRPSRQPALRRQPAHDRGGGLGLGIATAFAEVTPVEKRERVAALQAAGRRVLVAGDGVNDAPALTQADVGVAMSRGTDVTLESAEAVLVRDDLRLLPELVRLSRKTYRIIRENLFWALVYNVVAVPLAVAGLLHPIVAAAAMAASSTFVVLNSLRIRGGMLPRRAR